MKILIVDDSIATRMLLKSFFKDNNSYELFEAPNGKEAVEVFKSEKPDITFLDLTMPVMDGYEALKLIKEIDKNAAVIILTADIQKKSVERVMELGAYMVMKKLPVKEVIFKTIEEIKNKK
jgi:two-component system, chemotaxis family, chemotaxis protein CheY